VSERNETQWCTTCGARFTAEEVEGVSACPKCGDKGTPCDTANDVSVHVNWHELRVLGIWAENWAQHCTKTEPRDHPSGLLHVVHAITRRLQRQFPDKTPLTLSGEIMQVRDHGYGIESVGIAKNSMIPVNGPGAALPAAEHPTRNED
jgi:predicted RNA-binding Zn-ribbon protein involved in translation (DUF1610 family)